MSESEFWQTTPRYLSARIDGKQRDGRENWLMARQIGYWAIIPHSGKKKIYPRDLCRFHWEKEPVKLVLDNDKRAEMEKFKQIALEAMQKHEQAQ